MLIRNSNEKISKNFRMAEFYSTSSDAPEEHYFDDRIPVILQEIRDYFLCPVRVTSTFRTQAHQIQISGKKTSAHCLGIACDFTMRSKELSEFIYSIRTRGYWYESLREAGISGIGLYDSFVHIDTRTQENYPYFNATDQWGKVSLWGDNW